MIGCLVVPTFTKLTVSFVMGCLSHSFRMTNVYLLLVRAARPLSGCVRCPPPGGEVRSGSVMLLCAVPGHGESGRVRSREREGRGGGAGRSEDASLRAHCSNARRWLVEPRRSSPLVGMPELISLWRAEHGRAGLRGRVVRV